jgi:hypothetical protein
MQMVIGMKAHGKMGNALIMEFISTQTEIFTMDNGETI